MISRILRVFEISDLRIYLYNKVRIGGQHDFY